jgi:hypothetical protein
MPRKSIITRRRDETPEPENGDGIDILIVEDGDDELRRLSESLKGSFRLRHVLTGREASATLNKCPTVELVYLTMEFPTTPEDDLLGAEDVVFARFADDEDKAIQFLQANQGAFILHHLRRKVKRPVPVLFAHDFSSELERWDTMTSRYDNVYYCRSDMGAIDVADLIRTIIEKSRPEPL